MRARVFIDQRTPKKAFEVNAHRAHAFSARFSAGVRGPRVRLSRATRDIFWLFQKRVR
jgi:hypothetical protein